MLLHGMVACNVYDHVIVWTDIIMLSHGINATVVSMGHAKPREHDTWQVSLYSGMLDSTHLCYYQILQLVVITIYYQATLL